MRGGKPGCGNRNSTSRTWPNLPRISIVPLTMIGLKPIGESALKTAIPSNATTTAPARRHQGFEVRRLRSSSATGGKSHRGKAGDRAGHKDSRRTVQKIQQNQAPPDASQRRAEKVHAVNLSGRERAARQRQAHHDPGEYVGQGHGDQQQGPRNHRGERQRGRR